MPKRTDIKSILIIGAGPIVIGQACEFDYSGAQACKALRAEGYRVILVNSNPATIMTDPGSGRRHLYRADHAGDRRKDHREGASPTRCCRPWAARPRSTPRWRCATTACWRNTASRLIGASAEVIDRAEDRLLFRDAMAEIGLRDADSSHRSQTLDEARAALAEVGLPADHPAQSSPSAAPAAASPTTARSSSEIVAGGLDASPTTEVLIEESVLGWKEYEMEVVRDRADNCIIVCSIENVDPMGIHTGDFDHRGAGADADRQGIPAHARRLDRVLREIGVDTGGSNVQFARQSGRRAAWWSSR